jgi:hypothetical protein
MHIHELVERCRVAATTPEPVAEVMEALAGFLHQPHLDQQLGCATAPARAI